MAKLRAITIKGQHPVNVPIVYDVQPSPFSTPPNASSTTAAAPPASVYPPVAADQPAAVNRPAKFVKRVLPIALIIALFVGWTMYNKSKCQCESL